MKYAAQFKAALVREGFPPHWVDSAVPYSQLKKCIKKVMNEMEEIGLDPNILAKLIPTTTDQKTSSVRRQSEDGAVAYEYKLDIDNPNIPPKLTLFVRIENGLAVDATLSPETRGYLQHLVLRQSQDARQGEPEWSQDSSKNTPPQLDSTKKASDGPAIQRIEVPLTFDAEFFSLLRGDITTLDGLREEEKKIMSDEIMAVSRELTSVSKPTKWSKTDLYRWRELLDLYLQAEIFFSTRESDRGSRNSADALRQLQWFQLEVAKRGITASFKLATSHQALARFVSINVTLLRNLKFQEINQKAITKILKKFAKRTNLSTTETLSMLRPNKLIPSEAMAKAVCSQIAQDIVKIVPQIDDNLCPVCFSILWRPIRLKCNHVICIRCTIKLQRDEMRLCPICRDGVIMEANTDNIDNKFSAYLKKYFPKEVREKQIQLEIQSGIEQFGPYYKHPSEQKCLVM
ncbi:hypothetical protein B7494_g7081 [Chlorociboria aeruginascens]|nr:hypothetical protein B7494_g7081 [Chlorociboria aeruginascens]